MTSQLPPQRITHDAETIEEACEASRVNALPAALQTLVLAHHQDQFDTVSSYVEAQAADFVAFCNALGIQSESE